MKSVPCPFGKKTKKGSGTTDLTVGWPFIVWATSASALPPPIAWGLALLYCVFMVTRVLKKENT